MASRAEAAEKFKEANGYIINDVWYPRVTRIVSIKAKPGLEKFYKEVGGLETGEIISSRSAVEGAMVHEAVEALLLGQDVAVPPVVSASVTAFREFSAATHIHTIPEYVERKVWHDTHRYAGTVDVLAEINGKFGVLDIKTSQSIYRDYHLQTAAYLHALKGAFPSIETRWILRIDQIQLCRRCRATRRVKGGREKIRDNYSSHGVCPDHEWSELQGQVEFQEFPLWEGDFEAFLGAKRLWEWEHHDMLRHIRYLE